MMDLLGVLINGVLSLSVVLAYPTRIWDQRLKCHGSTDGNGWTRGRGPFANQIGMPWQSGQRAFISTYVSVFLLGRGVARGARVLKEYACSRHRGKRTL